jgi:hypothetical protein
VEKKPFEVWFEAKQSIEEGERRRGAWRLPALAQHAKWPPGHEVTEAEFDEAIENITGIRLGRARVVEEDVK